MVLVQGSFDRGSIRARKITGIWPADACFSINELILPIYLVGLGSDNHYVSHLTLQKNII